MEYVDDELARQARRIARLMQEGASGASPSTRDDDHIPLPPFHSFDAFRDAVVETVERMNAGLEGPEATWPGVLFVEVPRRGLVMAEMRSLEGLTEFGKRDLAARVLPNRIRATNADRFAWVMPAWRHDVEPRLESLVIVLGERGHTEAWVVDVLRDGDRPDLGDWRGPTTTVTGLFAEPLARALLAKRQPQRSARARDRRRERRPGRGAA